MDRTLEEILEAIWKADETGDGNLQGIQDKCPIPITEGDLEALERRELLKQQGSRLSMTDEGRSVARSIVRRHRLAETLFATILDLSFEKRESLACEVEHTLLPEVEEAICILLGHPTTCPDNKPIPPGACCSAKRKTISSLMTDLTDLEEGDTGRITFIRSQSHERLERLTALGLTPGTLVRVFQKSPAFCLEVEGTELALNRDAAEDIFVTKVALSWLTDRPEDSMPGARLTVFGSNLKS